MWLWVISWMFAQVLTRYDDVDLVEMLYGDDVVDEPMHQPYDDLIELAVDWLDAFDWIERRLDDDEAAEMQRLAVGRVTQGLLQPEEAAIRAAVVERYRAAGEPLPRWLLGAAARGFVDELGAPSRQSNQDPPQSSG